VETITLDAMRLFVEVASARSFTAAAAKLSLPKQTVSRRIAELERRLGTALLHRTTRRVAPTEHGAIYAERCAEILRLAEDANRSIADARDAPKGRLRITADVLFGETFVTPICIEYAKKWPEIELEVVLGERRFDLVGEGFDVAFRVGVLDDPALVARKLGPARVRYCASPSYVQRRGKPRQVRDLRAHDCLLHTSGAPVRWPFRGARGVALVPVRGRLRFSSLAMIHRAALKGLGIAVFPEFYCADDLARGRLVSVLDDAVTDAGAIWIAYPATRHPTARLRAFLDLAVARLSSDPRIATPGRR
jgi:DNA-binding transcriptional LysR family regulator